MRAGFSKKITGTRKLGSSLRISKRHLDNEVENDDEDDNG